MAQRAQHVSDIAFTPAVKAQQVRLGSRLAYEKMEGRGGWSDRVTPELARFIGERDSFYLGTAGADGQPYIQHRGGPKGFLKVVDDQTLAFADFSGNAQYISIGNLMENDKAFIFLTGISDLLAPDGTFIHPRAAERTKFCSAHNRPAPEAVTSAHADVEPTGAAAFRAFLRHRSTLVPFLRQPSLHSAARQPAGTGSAQILRSISPKSRRFR